MIPDTHLTTKAVRAKKLALRRIASAQHALFTAKVVMTKKGLCPEVTNLIKRSEAFLVEARSGLFECALDADVRKHNGVSRAFIHAGKYTGVKHEGGVL